MRSDEIPLHRKHVGVAGDVIVAQINDRDETNELSLLLRIEENDAYQDV